MAPPRCSRPTPSGTSGGLGRHHIGSNFFWYLKDPAGNFSEYYSDLDCIVDEALWKPGDVVETRIEGIGALRQTCVAAS